MADAAAQPNVLRGLVEESTGGGARRNDVEGGVWEYKVIERGGDKATVLSGKLRVKQSAAFDVPGTARGSLLDEGQAGEVAGGGPAGRGSGRRGGIGALRGGENLGVLDRIGESNRGGERIGDVTYEKSTNSTGATQKVGFRFDTDDGHPLSGEANAKPDTRNRGGVWRGVYTEKLADGKKRRWTFELRKIED